MQKALGGLLCGNRQYRHIYHRIHLVAMCQEPTCLYNVHNYHYKAKPCSRKAVMSPIGKAEVSLSLHTVARISGHGMGDDE